MLVWFTPLPGQEVSQSAKIAELEENYRKAIEENERLKQALEAARIELRALESALQRPEQAVEYQEAVVRLGRLIEAEPGNPALYKTRGIAFRHLGDYLQSIEDLSRAISLDGADASLYNERGTAYFLSRDLERAQHDFSKALALDPELAEAYHNRAVVARGLGDYVQAARDLRVAAKLGVAHAAKTFETVTAEVTAIQRRLDQLGLEPGPADGIPGPMTVSAIQRLQRDAGLEATGRVDIPTRAALRTGRRQTVRSTASSRLVERPRLVYPAAARERGWEGTVTLRIELLENGRVGSVEVAKSSGHPILDEAAVESVKSWQHEPATKNGVPMSRTINFDIEFRLDTEERE